MSIEPRRSFLKGIPAAIAGAMGLAVAKAAAADPVEDRIFAVGRPGPPVSSLIGDESPPIVLSRGQLEEEVRRLWRISAQHPGDEIRRAKCGAAAWALIWVQNPWRPGSGTGVTRCSNMWGTTPHDQWKD